MKRIFITGFQRGGTTLLRRLVHSHPEVECIIHERRILNRVKTFDKKTINKVIKNYKAWEGDVDGNWGEKIPWNSATGSEIITYINKWRQAFTENGKYINIIRNPADVGASNAKLGWLHPTIVNNSWWKSTPKVIKFVEDLGGLNIVYENLLLKPKEVLREIFIYCGLSYTEEVLDYLTGLDRQALRYFNKIDASRAFVNISEKDKSVYMNFVKKYWIDQG